MLTRASLCTLVLALVLTTVTVVVHWGLAPATGLVRSFYPTADFQSAPVSVERTTDVSLAFVTQNPSLPRRSFGVQWRGFWYLPEPRTIELLVATNDDILLQLDSATVIRRSARSGPQTVRRSVTLTKGIHEIVIRYRQHGSGMGLIVAGSLDGGRVRDLSAASVFAEPAGRFDLVMASAVPWLMTMAGVMWLAGVGLAIASRFVGGGQDQPSITRAAFMNRLRLIVAPALVGPVVLFVVGPLAIHTANHDEFVVAFTGILWPWAIGAVILSWTVLLVTGAMASLISERLTRLFAAALLAAGLLLWVQGTFMVADYGPLYGEGLDLRAHAGRVPYELALWAAVLLLAVVYARPAVRCRALAEPVVCRSSGSGCRSDADVHERRARSRENSWSTPPTSMYSLSRSNNVVHIVLDAYVSEMFGEAASQDPGYFNRTFSGFIYFADHLGAFPTTRASMPAMLAGETYRNAEPFKQFLDRTLLRRSIASVLAARGFAVRSITFHADEHPTAVSVPRIGDAL